MIDIFQKVKGRLIVSCQAEEGSPFNSPEGVGAFAQCAAQGGAAGIRSCGIEKTDYLIRHSRLPVIGLTKSHFADGFVRITGTSHRNHRKIKEFIFLIINYLNISYFLYFCHILPIFRYSVHF